MTNEEILEKIKNIKSVRDYIIESKRNDLVSFTDCKTIGCVWSLRLDTKYDYDLDVFNEIKAQSKANSIAVTYNKGLWIKLNYYNTQDASKKL